MCCLSNHQIQWIWIVQLKGPLFPASGNWNLSSLLQNQLALPLQNFLQIRTLWVRSKWAPIFLSLWHVQLRVLLFHHSGWSIYANCKQGWEFKKTDWTKHCLGPRPPQHTSKHLWCSNNANYVEPIGGSKPKFTLETTTLTISRRAMTALGFWRKYADKFFLWATKFFDRVLPV